MMSVVQRIFVASRVRLSADMHVLDFGCGTGLVTLPLASRVAFVTGVDTSTGMLDIFQQKARTRGLKNIRVVHLSSLDELTVAGQYHLIISSMTLHHIADIGKVLRYFYEALVPGGRIAIADLDEEGGSFHDNNWECPIVSLRR